MYVSSCVLSVSVPSPVHGLASTSLLSSVCHRHVCAVMSACPFCFVRPWNSAKVQKKTWLRTAGTVSPPSRRSPLPNTAPAPITVSGPRRCTPPLTHVQQTRNGPRKMFATRNSRSRLSNFASIQAEFYLISYSVDSDIFFGELAVQEFKPLSFLKTQEILNIPFSQKNTNGSTT